MPCRCVSLERCGFILDMDPKNVVALLRAFKAGTASDDEGKAASGDFSDLDSDCDKVETVCQRLSLRYAVTLLVPIGVN